VPLLLQLLKFQQVLFLKFKLLVLKLIIFLEMGLSMDLWFMFFGKIDGVIEFISILVVAVEFDVEVISVVPELGNRISCLFDDLLPLGYFIHAVHELDTLGVFSLKVLKHLLSIGIWLLLFESPI
jgi:hypothetical protein